MLIPITIAIISLILDGILTNFLPSLTNDLSLFTPLLTLVSIFLIYPFFKKKEKKYLIMIFIIGIIYDLLYTNLLFFNASLFLIIAIISIYIYKNFEIDYLKLIIYITIIIVVYELLTVLIIFGYNLVPITLNKVLYKITHSILLNIIYSEIIYFIIKKLPKKWKKISIN